MHDEERVSRPSGPSATAPSSAAAPSAPSDADGVAIEAVRFRPTPIGATERKRLLRPLPLAALAGALLVGWFLWFIFTAKSVSFEIAPTPATLALDGGFALRLGDVHLLRQGRYRVAATAPGHYAIDEPVRIGEARSQTIALTMTRLPGRVTFDISPAGAAVTIGGAAEPAGAAPFETLVAAGPASALVTHERYQSATVSFDVAGMDGAQTVTATLAPDWADVTLPTRPAGAQVLIDGEATGAATPGPIEVLAGERRIAARLDGYQTWTDILHVEAGKDLLLPPVALKRAGSRLAVATTPAGASVTVDGAYQGTTPLQVDVAPGRHDVRVFKVGYAAQERRVQSRSGGRESVSFALDALQGELAVQTQPEDAELWIDGQLHGPARGVVTLTAVPHEVEIKKPGFASYRKTVTPQPGFTQQLKVRLLTLEEARMAALQRVRRSGAGHELVLLRPGEIQMGASRREPGRRANEVLRTAKLTRLFYLGRHEVTNAQFRAFASGHSSGDFQNIGLDEDDQPVVEVSWREAAQYCNWLSRQDGLAPFYREEYGDVVGFDAAALGYRLPTEAEWAWAARDAGDEGGALRFAWGDKLPPPERHGNYADRSAAHLVARVILGYNDNYIASAPIGAFPANAKGIHDIGGNVAEWIHDYYQIPDAGEATDPLGPERGDYHVIRGASWQKGTVTDLRLSFRDYGSAGRQDLGFRIARFAE